MNRIISQILFLPLLCTVLGISMGAKAQDYIWAKHIVTSEYSAPKSFAQDGDGNLIVVGTFNGTIDLDPGPNVFNVSTPPGAFGNTFIQKLSSDGQFLAGATLEGSDSNRPITVVANEDGGIYIYGRIYGPCDFDPGAGTELLVAPSGGLYLTRLDPAFNYQWAHVLPSVDIHPITSSSMAKDASGSVYITGVFMDSMDFDLGPGVHIVHAHGPTGTVGLRDAFIAKYDGGGNLAWVHPIGGKYSEDNGNAVCVGASGVYFTGTFGDTTDFDPGMGTYNLIETDGYDDGFVAHYTFAGDLVWARQIVASDNNYLTSIAVDNDDNVLVNGYFFGSLDADPSNDTYQFIPQGESDIVVFKLDEDGNFLWAGQVGGTHLDASSDMSIDVNGACYLSVSWYDAADFDPGLGTSILNSNGGSYDITLLKINSLGFPERVTQLGGAGGEYLSQTLIDGGGNIYGIGTFTSLVDFDPSPTNSAVLSGTTNNDGFIFKWGQSGFTGSEQASEYLLGDAYVFPNPVAGNSSNSQVHLHSNRPVQSVRVVNMLGQVAWEWSGTATTDIVWDASKWVNGLYTVQLLGGQSGKYATSLHLVVE